MVMNVMGVEHKPPGEFENAQKKLIKYDNIYIHSAKPNVYDKEDSFACGKAPVTIKIKNDREVVYSIFGSYLTIDDFKSMVGQDFDFYFDEKGNITRIVELAPPSSKKGA